MEKGNMSYVVLSTPCTVGLDAKHSVLGSIYPTPISVPRRNLHDTRSARPLDGCYPQKAVVEVERDDKYNNNIMVLAVLLHSQSKESYHPHFQEPLSPISVSLCPHITSPRHKQFSWALPPIILRETGRIAGTV